MKLSIIIPTYNCGHLIAKCLQSLVNQEIRGGYEIIVVDDGSTDDTIHVLQEFEKNYPSLIRVLKKTNGGVSSARNAGLWIAKGEWVYFCDSDDWVQDYSLGKILEFTDRVDVGLIGFQLNHVNSRSFIMNTPVSYNVIYKGTGRDYFLSQLFWCTWLFIFKRNTILINKLLFKPIISSEDGLFNIEYLLSMQGNEKVIKLDAKIYNYYANPDSVTHVFDPKNAIIFLDNYFHFFDFCNEILSKYRLTGQLRERVQWVKAKNIPNYMARMIHSDMPLNRIKAESCRLKRVGAIPFEAKHALSIKERFQGFILQYPLLFVIFRFMFAKLKGYQ